MAGLYRHQVTQRERYLTWADRQQLLPIRLIPLRGKILDCRGAPMAVSLEGGSLFSHPASVEDPVLTARLLAPHLEMDARSLRERLKRSLSFVWLARQLPLQKARAIQKLGLSGIGMEKEGKRYYPNRDLAANVIGFVGVDSQGLEGLELYYEGRVRGAQASLLLQRDARGRLLWREMAEAQDLGRGGEIALTLDLRIQFAAERTLRQAVEDTEHITLLADGKEILKYRKAMIEALEGTDPLYRKPGAYIHPLYSPAGKVLTRIQPPDHYHHFGIWNPWTKTFFEGRQVDFWNLAAAQGTVRYKETLLTSSGEKFAGFKVSQEHVDFSAEDGEKIAMNEIWDVKAWQIEVNDRPVWMIDFVFTLSCATDSLVNLAQYRYGGGIGFRATEAWTNQNSAVLTSEGKTRVDADASNARWCMLSGETGQDHISGLIFMSHTGNQAHPEPMRVWPEDMMDLFFEFCPIRHEGWIIHPGKEYVLKYRVLVYDGEIDAGTAENLWQDYVNSEY